MGIVVFVACFVVLFVPLQRAMIRSAKSTSQFTDPAMHNSLVGIAAERNMTFRYIIGTVGVLVAALMGTIIISGIVSAVFGIPFME
jgi:hypothetical protein